MAVSEEKEALLQDMEEKKQEIQIAVQELAEVARTWPSPRERIRANPGAWLLGGFVFGLVIGVRHRD
jgi:hypothetical protein